MKITTSIIFILFFSSTFWGQKTESPYFIYAMSGLKMRTSPAKDSSLITKIPFGTEVKIIDENLESPEIIIDGLKGRYILTEYADTTGYIFSGYISRIPVPNLTDSWFELKDYLVEKFGKSEKKTSTKEPNPYDSTDTRYGVKYSDDIEYYDFGEECNTNERMIIKDITVREAFLFLTTFNAQYRNIKLDKPATYDKDSGSYSSDQPVQYYQYYRSLSYKKDKNNNLIYIDICFDTESGSGCASIRKSKTKENVIIIEFSYSCS